MNDSGANVWKPSVVAQALSRALGTLLGGAAPLAISYGNNREALWALDDWLKAQFDAEALNGLVLIWDGSADPVAIAGRNTGEYLNPLTWTLCAVKRYPALRIAILDCDAPKHSTGRFFKVVQALDPDRRPFGLMTDPCRCVADCLDFLAEDRPQDSTTVTDLLTHQVKSMLTERSAESDHHALANIIGPLILLGDKSRGKDPTHRALLALFREIGLLGHIKQEPGGHPPPHELAGQQSSPPVFGGRPVRLLLVDDQCGHGWRDWVASMVANEKGCHLEATAKPDILVKAVEIALAQVGEASDCRFRLSFPSLATAKPAAPPTPVLSSFLADMVTPPSKPPESETILLLDLRLFSLLSEQEEAEFVSKKLLPLCRRFEEREGRSYAWPGFTTNELEAATDWCANPIRNNDPHLIVLSLLPRLVALCDLSTPIVLFSSTGERRNIALLKPYGNIVTEFEKPRFTGLESADLIEETEARFRAALAKAFEIAAAGRKISNLRSLPLTQYDQAKRLFQNKKHIEIFHDESSDTNSRYFRVAAFAVGFPTKEDADATDRHIEQYGPHFFGARALEKITKDEVAAKVQWEYEIAKPLASALRAGNALSLLPFVVVSGERFSSPSDADPFSLLDPSGLDNINQDLMRLLLETMIIDSLAWIAEDGSQCSVFGATRMRRQPSADKPDCDAIKTELFKRWKIASPVYPKQDPDSGEWSFAWQSFRADSLHVALNELASARGRSDKGMTFAKGIVRAYCISLPYKDPHPPRGYSFLHSIADIIARLVDVDFNKTQVDWRGLERIEDLPLPVRGAAGLRAQIVRILNCHRALDEGDLVDGFGYGLFVDHKHDVAGNVVALRMRNLIPSLTGDDLMRIVRHVAKGGPSRTHSPRLQDGLSGAISDNQKPRNGPAYPPGRSR